MFFLMRGTIGLRFPRLGISQVRSRPVRRCRSVTHCWTIALSGRVDTPTPYTRDFIYRRDRLVVRTAKRSSPSVLSKYTARMLHAVELVVRRSKYLNGWSNVVGRQVAGAGARPGVSLTVGGVGFQAIQKIAIITPLVDHLEESLLSQETPTCHTNSIKSIQTRR